MIVAVSRRVVTRWRHAQPNTQVQLLEPAGMAVQIPAFQSVELSSGLTSGGTLVSGRVAYSLPFVQCLSNSAICH